MVPPIFVAFGDLIRPITGASGAAYAPPTADSVAGSRVVFAGAEGRLALSPRLGGDEPLCGLASSYSSRSSPFGRMLPLPMRRDKP